MLIKRILFCLGLLITAQVLSTSAQSIINEQQKRPFEGHFYCPETDVHIYLNLYEENIEVPGFSFLGCTHGYMNGRIYGTWMLVRHSIDQQTATLRFSNDIGSDTQVVRFTQNPDSTYTYQALHGNAVRQAIGRRLVKTTGHMIFKRK